MGINNDVIHIVNNYPKCDESGHYHLDFYVPYRNPDGTRNSGFTAFSGSILDLKQNKVRSEGVFFPALNQVMKPGVPIVIVPSHDPEKKESSLQKLAQKLVNEGRINALKCLQRTEKIESLHSGGDRRMEVHLGSIKVINSEIIKGHHVLLLDDVTTSGNTFNACTQLLIEAGASNVTCLAIGKTKR
jgi:predicted amidophosphoribosyltransferase